MKIIRIIFTVLAAAITLGACAQKQAGQAAAPSQNKTDMKALIIYFTHSGNTELAAKEVAQATGAKMIRLLPEKPYSTEDVDWVNEQSRCTQEHLNPKLRPAIRPVEADFAAIDTLFLGFPIWWHEEPAVIRTFLDRYGEQLKGKVIYPFCTSYESPVTEADESLQKNYPQLNWKQGLRLPASRQTIREWIEQ